MCSNHHGSLLCAWPAQISNQLPPLGFGRLSVSPCSNIECVCITFELTRPRPRPLPLPLPLESLSPEWGRFGLESLLEEAACSKPAVELK